jgi:long-chain acyl-CoA synthetase
VSTIPQLQAEQIHPPVREPLSADEPATLVEVYQRAVRRHPKPDTLNYKSAGRWHAISGDEMLRHARWIALGLYSLGVRKGDRVALLSESCVEWVLADQGCIFNGAVSVPIYPTLTPPQVQYIVKDCGAKVLLVSTREKFAEVQTVVRECAAVENVVLLDANGANGVNGSSGSAILSLAQLEARGRSLESSQPSLSAELAQAARPDDLATIIYTSGTTGEPKGVMLAHSNMVSNLIDSSDHFKFGEKDSALSVLPLSHIFERQAMNMYLHHGMTVYFGESLEKIGDNLREVQPTVFVGVPRIYEKILARVQEKAMAKGKLNGSFCNWAIEIGKQWAQLKIGSQPIPLWLRLRRQLADAFVYAKWRKAMGGRIRIFVSGGASLADDVALAFAGAGMPMVQGYGLTETSPVITAGRLDDNRTGTVGKPIRSVEVRIAADGEIEARGPNIMRGYWNKPEQTQAVFTDDGWFKTGDIGHLDAEGFLTITDRKKELLKTSGGKYIAPQPIEQLIKSSRFVNQVVVIGDKRKFASVLIVPDWDQLDAYAKLKGLNLKTREEFCRHPRIIDLFERQIAARTQNLAQFEKIKKIALLDQEMTVEGGELTPTLKVKRRVIDEKYRDAIDRIYAAGLSAEATT